MFFAKISFWNLSNSIILIVGLGLPNAKSLLALILYNISTKCKTFNRNSTSVSIYSSAFAHPIVKINSKNLINQV